MPGQGYYNLPRFIGENYSDVSELRCITVFIPDSDEYVAQLLALMNIAGQKTAWYTPDDAMRVTRSEIWQRAYRETLECIVCGCFDCDDVLSCIETNQAVRDAIASIAGTAGSTPPGVGTQTPERVAENMAGNSNPTCDYDILWSQCLEIVRYTNRVIEDVLERIEVDTAIVEIASILQNFPVIALASETVGVQFFADLLNFVQEILAEGYIAQYDETYEIELACELFCLCSGDCSITIERMAQVMEDRVSLPVQSDLLSMIGAVTAATIIATNVCNYAFWWAWTGAETINSFFMGAFDNFVKTILLLQADEPDNDWEVHCGDCVGFWEHEFIFTSSNGGFSAFGSVDNAATWFPGTGWVGNAQPQSGVPANSIANMVIGRAITNPGGILRECELDVTWDTVPSFDSGAYLRHSNGYVYYRVQGYDDTHMIGYMPGTYSFNSQSEDQSYATTGMPETLPAGTLVMTIPAYFFTSPSAAQVICTRLRISGTGNDPFA